MKQISMLALLLLGMATSPSVAQSRFVAPVGVVEGELHYPHATLAIDLQIQQEQVIAGPYARYALKYLGLRAPLSDKESYSLHTVALSLLEEEALTSPQLPAEEFSVRDYTQSTTAFPELTADRIDLLQPTAESAAQQAAARIFQLRRSRLDLITGEAGEHVFGEGLQVALDEIARQEQALLELFLGKQILREITCRVEVQPTSDNRQYIVGRFSPSKGLVSASDLSGEIVLLEILPEAPYVVEGIPAKSKQKFRVAAPARCVVSMAGNELGSRTLPLFEFGETFPKE